MINWYASAGIRFWSIEADISIFAGDERHSPVWHWHAGDEPQKGSVDGIHPDALRFLHGCDRHRRPGIPLITNVSVPHEVSDIDCQN